MALRALAVAGGLAASVSGAAAASGGLDQALLARALQRAEALPRPHALIVARDGTVRAERAFRGPGISVPVNIKSVSKTVIAALVGIAIGRGALKGTQQPTFPDIIIDQSDS